MMTSRSWFLFVALTLAACGGGSQSGAAGGEGGSGAGTTSSSTGAGAGGMGGTGGAGGSDPCAPVMPGTLSFKGVHSNTYDSMTEQVSGSFGDPNTSTLAAYPLDDTLMIEAKSGTWEAEFSMHLEPNVSPPLTITPTSYPNTLFYAGFSRGAGLANSFSSEDSFKVTIKATGCRLTGTFSGVTTSVDGFEILTVSQGAFDVPIGEAP